jgi:hypothetical protein
MFRAQQTSPGLHIALFRFSPCSAIIRAKYGRKLLDLALSSPISATQIWNQLLPKAAPFAWRTIEVRNVAPHSCGTERQRQINLLIVGGKFPPAHESYRESIGIMVPEWQQVSLNSRLPNLTPACSAFLLKVTPRK